MSKRWTVVLLVIVGSLAGLALATIPGAGVVYGVAAAPPRPTPLPLPTATPVSPVRGGFIELHLSPRAKLWTKVEWQGTGGTWHDVDGWRGAPDEAGVVRWYAGPELLGQGPFRWLVSDGVDGPLLGASAPFYLPAQARQVVAITVELPAGAK